MHMTGQGAQMWNDFQPDSNVHVICQLRCLTQNLHTKSVNQKATTSTTSLTKKAVTTTKAVVIVTTKTTQKSPVESGLGFVSACSLNGTVHNFNVDGYSYCAVVQKQYYEHSPAVEVCRKLNARLPLPRNKEEVDAIRKITGFEPIHVDARNPKKTKNKAEWVDAENKPIGTRDVYLRVRNFISKSKKTVKAS